MNSRPPIAVAVVVVIAVGAFVYLQREPTPKTAQSIRKPAVSVATVEASNVAAEATPEPAAMTREVSAGEENEVLLLPALPLYKGELAWEARIRQAMETPGASDDVIARKLFAILPGLPVEGKVKATEEAIQRTPSAEYRDIAQPVIGNVATYPPALIVLFSDLMERPPEVQLPTLLSIARNPAHPLAKQAQENLEFVLKQKLGFDWGRWDAAIRERLAGGQ